jgi:uncharacterized protein YgiM (DUF1202 family)
MLKPFITVILSLGIYSVVFAAQTGTINKNVDLKSEPSLQANTVSKLSAGDNVTIIKRQGGWYQINADKNTGWIDMLTVRMTTSASKSNDNGLGNLVGLVTGSGTTTTVATGVRGIDEVDLQNAQPDTTALHRMESYHVSGANARQFAQQGGLTARTYTYITH